MQDYLIELSKTGVNIDYSFTVERETKLEWFDMQDFLYKYDCDFYTVYKLDNRGEIAGVVEC